jgi:DNA-binding MarR family transcriptional regulator
MGSDSELYEGLASFRHALRRFLATSETASRRAGVTPQQYQALLAVKAWPGDTMAIKDLAEQLLLTHQAAVQMLDRLERAGFAERAPSLGDRRSVLIRLTPKGESLLSGLVEAHAAAMYGLGEELSRSLEQVLRLTEPLCERGDRPKDRADRPTSRS